MNEWTFLIDMAGNNSLSRNTDADLMEISEGSSDRVSVSVQLNRSSQDTQRLCMEDRKLVERQRFRNVSSGSPYSLTDFIRWAAENQPGHNTLLCLWSHGNGWLDFRSLSLQAQAERAPDGDAHSEERISKRLLTPVGLKDVLPQSRTQFFSTNYSLQSLKPRGRFPKALGLDFPGIRFNHALLPALGPITPTSTGLNEPPDQQGSSYETSVARHPFLSNADLGQALKDALEPGQKFGIIGCDACWMSMVEVAYEVREYGEIFIGSEDEEDTDGWPYKPILERLAKGQVRPVDGARIIVAEYGKANDENPFATLSAIRLDRMDHLADALDAVGGALRREMPLISPKGIDKKASGEQKAWLELIRKARRHTRHFKQFAYIDLYDFALQLMDVFAHAGPSPLARKVVATASTLSAVADESVIVAFDNDQRGTARGISVYLPNETVASNYKDLSLCEAAPRWEAFVVAYGNSFVT